MPSESGAMARPHSPRASQVPRLQVPACRVPGPMPVQRIGSQQAIVLRDAGRALLAVAASDVAMEVPELPHLDALQDYQDELFVVGYFDETFQKQVDTEFLAHDVRALAHALIAIGQDVTPHAFEQIVTTALRVATGSRQESISTLAGGISRLVANLMQELQPEAVRA